MTDREEKRLAELLAKKEAEEKAEAEFFKQVKKRKSEVLNFLGLPEDPEYNFKNDYYEIKALVDRLMYLCYKDYDSDNCIEYFQKYVTYREKQVAKKNSTN